MSGDPAPAVEIRAFERVEDAGAHALPLDAAVVVFDVLRATSTMIAALASGASCIIPVATPEEALARRAAAGEGAIVVAGERKGAAPAGFDLGNSPREFTSARVHGRSVVLTTTNGTRAIFAAAACRRVLIGALVNRAAVAAALEADPGPIVLLASGTDGHATAEDTLAVGAVVAALLERRALHLDLMASAALGAWRTASVDASTLRRAMRESRGGQNLAAIGLERDIDDCGRVDSTTLVPVVRGSRVVAQR